MRARGTPLCAIRGIFFLSQCYPSESSRRTSPTMAIGKILAPLTGGARDATVLASAFAAARPFNAHVIALFVRPDPAQAMPFFGEGVSGVVVQEIVDVAKDAADKAAEQAMKSLRLAAEADGILVLDAPAHRDAPSVSFRD